MKNNWENFDKDTKLIVKELSKDSKNFNNLLSKLNSAKKNLQNRHELIEVIEQIKK